MATYLDPNNGAIVRAPENPGGHLVPVTGSGTLLRTREDDGRWTARRCSFRALEEASDTGWELVSRERHPLPEQFMVGATSGLRFGFAALTRWERECVGDVTGTAVVLPDEPGLKSAENCPGSRYMFQIGMLIGGVPEDYLVEKLLTHRTRRAGLPPDRSFLHPRWPWQKEIVEELMQLATRLSNDLQAAALQTFGSDHACNVWNREILDLLPKHPTRSAAGT